MAVETVETIVVDDDEEHERDDNYFGYPSYYSPTTMLGTQGTLPATSFFHNSSPQNDPKKRGKLQNY
jgi:hypothetical protein